MVNSSPRFVGVPQLTQAATNSPWLSQGARGHGVHLIQFALIDLGFPMPGSTGGRGMSPDGIFGSETKRKVEEFQRSALGGVAVKDDGIVGTDTMGKLDRAIGGFTHQTTVTIHTARPSAISVFEMEQLAGKIYAHYGIKFVTRWGRCMDLKEPHDTVLHTQGSSKADLKEAVTKGVGGTLTAIDTTAVQIARMTPDDAYAVTDSDAQMALIRLQDDAKVSTLAHEVGHVLLTPAAGHDKEDHETQANNLMTTGDRVPPFVLTVEQVTEMRGHARCRTV